MPVPDLQDAAEVDGGCAFTCARHTNGRVSCWGSNELGQLGDGTFMNRVAPAPVEAASGDPIENVSAMAVGCEHACVVQEGETAGEGTVLCWGVNSDGSLGTGSFGAPITSPTSTGITDAIEVAAGNPFSCARRSSGIALCWGFNRSGQLGDGTTVSRPSPTPVSMLTDATSLYVDNGDLHSCAIRSDMSVVCWGSNEYGQLGNGEKYSAPELRPVRTRGI